LRWLLCPLLLCTLASAQIPDVRFHLDLTGALVAVDNGPAKLELYDNLGRTSTLNLTFFLEPGLRAYASERIQQIENDPSRDPMEEYSVEDPGSWRVGKQFLPFGSGQILRDNVLAARGDTNLVFENLKITAAVCDGGSGLEQGVVARIGNRLGFSAAVGDHFGIAPTSLDFIRLPEDTPGAGRGWKQAYGIDASHKSGIFTTRADGVLLESGDTPMDRDTALSDISESILPNKYQSLTLGWTHDDENGIDFYRVVGTVQFTKTTTFAPMVRFRDGKLYDFTLELRVHL